MKFLNLLLFFFISNISLAQNANVYISNFDAENSALKNGKIQYFNATGDTTYNFRLTVGRNFSTTPMPAIRITAIAVFDNYGTEYAASDSLYFTQSDFSAFNGTETPIIYKKFTLKSNKKVGSLKIKYRFLVSYPGYSGWTNWFYSNKTYQTQQYEPPAPVIPSPIFTGPSLICSDGIYNITNPGTITLENAIGIATLSSLGNNQWKVTRSGQADGNVVLRSINSNGQVSNQEIKVGSNTFAGNFFKPPMIGAGNYSIRFTDPHNDFDPNSITWSVSSTTNNVELLNTTGKFVTVKVNTWNNNSHNYITLHFNATTVCGQTVSRGIAIGPGSEILNPDS